MTAVSSPLTVLMQTVVEAASLPPPDCLRAPPHTPTCRVLGYGSGQDNVSEGQVCLFLSHTHTHTHTHTHSTQLNTHSLSHILSLTTLTHTLTHSRHTHCHTLTHTHSYTHTPYTFNTTQHTHIPIHFCILSYTLNTLSHIHRHTHTHHGS